MANTLIIRHHSIGDALIVLPLVAELAMSYKEDSFTVVSNGRFEYLFEFMPENVTFIPAVTRSPTGIFRGVSFLIRRFFFEQRMIRMSKKFDKIAFLQFDELGKKIYKSIQQNKLNIQTAITDETSFFAPERITTRFNDGLSMIGFHRKTLEKLGYKDIQPQPAQVVYKDEKLQALPPELAFNESVKLIAIAPFAKIDSKIYPLDKTEEVIAYFAKQPEKYKVLLFGGGSKEKKIAEEWEQKYTGVFSTIGKYAYETEVLLMTRCKVTLSMDSSNMHLAAFLGVPVVSVWGPTLPKVGFYPMNVNPENAIYLNLECQPCSFFGEKECHNKIPFSCFNLPPDLIIKKIEAMVEKSKNK